MQTTSIKTILAVAGAVSLVAGPANALSQTGIASFYDTGSGTQTASGQRLNDHALTAAMRVPVPLGTQVRVTNLGNGRVVTVTINDRGPLRTR
jgi:rare lipoprotein A